MKKAKTKTQYQETIKKTTHLSLENQRTIVSRMKSSMLDIDSVCDLLRLDNKMVNECLQQEEYSEFALDVRQALAEIEEKLVTQWVIGGEKTMSVGAQAFLTSRLPKYSTKFKNNVQYEVLSVLQIVREIMDNNQYKELLSILKGRDATELVIQWDDYILNNNFN